MIIFHVVHQSSSPANRVSLPTVSPIRRGVRKETHLTHARIDFSVSAPSRVWPGSLPDVQLWRGYAYRAVSTLDFARGIHSRVWNANVTRAEFPLVADALHRSRNGLATITVATGYRSLPIARRALNFNLANLACRWLTASGERPGSLSSWLTIRICFYLSTKWLINNVSIFSIASRFQFRSFTIIECTVKWDFIYCNYALLWHWLLGFLVENI